MVVSHGPSTHRLVEWFVQQPPCIAGVRKYKLSQRKTGEAEPKPGERAEGGALPPPSE